MTKIRTCAACGLDDPTVAMRLIELPPVRRRMVEVRLRFELCHTADNRYDAIEIVQTVPERLVAELRCRDATACAARVRALR